MDVGVSDVSSRQTRKQSLAKSAGETAAERAGITLKCFKDFHLKMAQAKARIWPWLPYLCQAHSTAVGVKKGLEILNLAESEPCKPCKAREFTAGAS